MPYIKKEDREKYQDALKKMPVPSTKGELEYCIYSMMLIYMSDKEQRYSTLHDCTYAAAHCADEFRRRFLDKREDSAIIQNGDIHPPEWAD